MTAAIEVSGLVKHYGQVKALDGVDLEVPAGSVFGFLGPNGAGKTTTLRILLGLSRPTSGAATVFGVDAVTDGMRARRDIGFVPDVPACYPWMRAPEALALVGQLSGVRGPVLAERIEVLLALAGLTGVKQHVGGFSRGMKQRLGIAQALIGAPRLLLLDEPTSALDPLGRKAVLDLIAALRGRTTVFFSTHILDDVERVCDEVAIVDRGRVLVQQALPELVARYGGGSALLVEVTSRTAELSAALAREPWVGGVEPDGTALRVKVREVDSGWRRIPELVVELGVGLRRLESADITLEDVFVDLVSGPQEVLS